MLVLAGAVLTGVLVAREATPPLVVTLRPMEEHLARGALPQKPIQAAVGALQVRGLQPLAAIRP